MQSNSKMKFLLLNLTLFSIFNSVAQSSPSHFKSDLDFGNGIVITTFFDLEIKNDQFTMTSPKDADVRIAGGKAKLGRLLGKSPKNGIIMTVRGTQKSDSLFGETKVPMIGELKFAGRVKENIVSGSFLNANGLPVGTLYGTATAEHKIDYGPLFPKLITTVRENVYSASVLQTSEWKKFEKGVNKLCLLAQDDIDMYFGFNMLARQLPFSHLTLIIADDVEEPDGEQRDDATPTQKSVIFEEKNSTTAYLKIKNFSTSTAELEAILPKIVANATYKNLILDFRNNGGGGIDAAFALAKHIVSDDLEVGFFVTNKLRYSGYQPELFNTLPALQPKSTEAFTNELKLIPGVKLIFSKPENPVFSGRIYVLTNNNTASTCEPIVYTLKNNKKAMIIGERTNGAMLAASPFVVSEKYTLMVPIADFYTSDGIRLDRAGVSPDVEVMSDEALNKALEIISENRAD